MKFEPTAGSFAKPRRGFTRSWRHDILLTGWCPGWATFIQPWQPSEGRDTAIEDDAERRAARELGQQMRRLRERKGWTAKALGRKAGDYDRSTISCIETGHGKCSLQLIRGCDDALGAGGAGQDLFRAQGGAGPAQGSQPGAGSKAGG
ncbi:MAG: helix-turn-helix domain-containing protein [Actinomycetota bacterium]